MTTTLQHPELRALQHDIHNTVTSGQSLSGLAARLRNQSALLARLPAPFAPALDQIVQRMEAGALFTEESCSFSQGDLIAALEVWLQKADSRLE